MIYGSNRHEMQLNRQIIPVQLNVTHLPLYRPAYCVHVRLHYRYLFALADAYAALCYACIQFPQDQLGFLFPKCATIFRFPLVTAIFRATIRKGEEHSPPIFSDTCCIPKATVS